MDKQHILDEIKRTAEENGGKALGVARFLAETGIRESDWIGRYWARWGDALLEAGYSPNVKVEAIPEEYVLDCLARFILDIDHYPTIPEIKMRGRNDPDFPSHNVFQRKGRKAELAAKVIEYCAAKPEFDKVAAICEPVAAQKPKHKVESPEAGSDGFVYLMKSGKHFKIGFTNSVDRRRYELGPKLPLGIEPIHSVRTDDPAGIEAYWHRRFKDKHLNGEWFDLSPQDVTAFKRRKFM